jgi:molybdate transport system substrate-binding protein
MASPRIPARPTTGRPITRRAGVLVLVLVSAFALLAGCSSGSSDTSTSPDPSTTGSNVTGTVTVFAAASLNDAFTEVAEAFEAAHPDADVTLNFGASSALAQQIVEGAPADVFASADEANMAKAVDADAVSGRPEPFATNSLRIIVAPGNPEGITGLADLSRSGLIYVTAGPEVPIGRYAAQALEEAGVSVSPRSLETDVKAVVTKVTSGEADAGIVYATDVTAAGDRAEGVDIPSSVNVAATYPLAVTTEARNPAGAEAWVDFVLGGRGQDILASYGFGAP